MTVLECLQQCREEAEPILARNGRISLAVGAEGLACLDGMGTEMDAGPRRLSRKRAGVGVGSDSPRRAVPEAVHGRMNAQRPDGALSSAGPPREGEGWR